MTCAWQWSDLRAVLHGMENREFTKTFRSTNVSTSGCRTSKGIHPWEFEKDGRTVNVRVTGQIIVNSSLRTNAALDGLGLAYMLAE